MDHHINHRTETISLDTIKKLGLQSGRTWTDHETDGITQRQLIAIHAYAGPEEIRIRLDGHTLWIGAHHGDRLDGLLRIDHALDDDTLATRLRTAILILTNHWDRITE